jgi:hypothetical protein
MMVTTPLRIAGGLLGKSNIVIKETIVGLTMEAIVKRSPNGLVI